MAIAAERFISRKGRPDEKLLREACEHFRQAALEEPKLWSPLVNLHWLADYLKDGVLAAWALEEASRRKITSPLAAAYFARVENQKGDSDRCLAWLGWADPPTDGWIRMEMAIVAMEAHAARADAESVLRIYADRIRDNMGGRDKNHVIMHIAYAAEKLPPAIRSRLDAAVFQRGLCRLIREEPDEPGHIMTLLGLLSGLGKWSEAAEVLIQSIPRFRNSELFRDHAIYSAWRILEKRDLPRPN